MNKRRFVEDDVIARNYMERECEKEEEFLYGLKRYGKVKKCKMPFCNRILSKWNKSGLCQGCYLEVYKKENKK